MNKEKQSLVSVGIPTYNRPEGLIHTLECILNQTYRNLEVIVSDNGSQSNETESIVKEFIHNDRRIRFFRQQQNMGIEWNFKFVLEKSSGKYFMWAADDDGWGENFIEACILNIGESTGIMTGISVNIKETGKTFELDTPSLNLGNSKFINAKNFIKGMRSSLFYGVYKREDILFILKDNFFDWYDCYFVLKIIIEFSFKTISDKLYFAGIERTDYKPKPLYKRKGRNLSYHLFYKRFLLLIIKTKNLTFIQKIKISSLFTMAILRLFVNYEKDYRLFQVYIIRFILKIINGGKTLLSKSKKVLNTNPLNKFVKSYSQCGEDIIVNYIFCLRGVLNPTYIDIGAHDPFFLNNTAIFYNKKSKGINIEANPYLISRFNKYRPKDINLNIGIGSKECELDFYIMNDPSLSSFSKEEILKYENTGKYFVIEIKRIQLITLKNIIEKYNDGIFPDFLTIDTEGMDFEILKTIDYKNNTPKVICVETAEYSPIGAGQRRTELIDFLGQNGYFEYANTNLNAIMVKRDFWFI